MSDTSALPKDSVAPKRRWGWPARVRAFVRGSAIGLAATVSVASAMWLLRPNGQPADVLIAMLAAAAIAAWLAIQRRLSGAGSWPIPSSVATELRDVLFVVWGCLAATAAAMSVTSRLGAWLKLQFHGTFLTSAVVPATTLAAAATLLGMLAIALLLPGALAHRRCAGRVDHAAASDLLLFGAAWLPISIGLLLIWPLQTSSRFAAGAEWMEMPLAFLVAGLAATAGYAAARRPWRIASSPPFSLWLVLPEAEPSLKIASRALESLTRHWPHGPVTWLLPAGLRIHGEHASLVRRIGALEALRPDQAHRLDEWLSHVPPAERWRCLRQREIHPVRDLLIDIAKRHVGSDDAVVILTRDLSIVNEWRVALPGIRTAIGWLHSELPANKTFIAQCMVGTDRKKASKTLLQMLAPPAPTGSRTADKPAEPRVQSDPNIAKPGEPKARESEPGNIETDSSVATPSTDETSPSSIQKVEKTVFLCYRRADSALALLIFKDLTQHGFDVFIYRDGIASGDFERAIVDNIKARAHFVVLLTPTTLDRCTDPDDWLRREIETALSARRNVVPVLLSGFDFSLPAVVDQLAGSLAALRDYQALRVAESYFDAAMERLRNQFLTVPIDAVLHPPSLHAQQAAIEQQQAPVERFKQVRDVIDLTGTTIAQRYSIQRMIGEGAMGNVYLAQDVSRQNMPCALKVLKRHLTHDPKFGHRFAVEAESLARLNHPHILKMHEFFHDGEDYFIALAFVDGMSLADMIDREGPIAERRALALFKPILSALDHGHQNGIIHRDVKPANVLVASSGHPWLCDFGIAKQVAVRGVTATGVTLGTPEYMSPEQVQSPQSLDHRSDVYSAGIVLYEMLTGRVPFGAQTSDSDLSIRRRQVESDPPDPRTFNPDIPDALARIIMKSIRKLPGRRYQGCSDFLSAIDRYEQGPEEGDDDDTGDSIQPEESDIPRGSRPFRVYEHRRRGTAAVAEGFCWPALLNIVWMFAQQLYVQAVVWAGLYLLLAIIINGSPRMSDAEQFVLVAAFLVLWLVPGLRGNAWRQKELERRGFVLKGTVTAPTADDALEHLARWR